jgi:hypothetical protein
VKLKVKAKVKLSLCLTKHHAMMTHPPKSMGKTSTAKLRTQHLLFWAGRAIYSMFQTINSSYPMGKGVSIYEGKAAGA